MRIESFFLKKMYIDDQKFEIPMQFDKCLNVVECPPSHTGGKVTT